MRRVKSHTDGDDAGAAGEPTPLNRIRNPSITTHGHRRFRLRLHLPQSHPPLNSRHSNSTAPASPAKPAHPTHPEHTRQIQHAQYNRRIRSPVFPETRVRPDILRCRAYPPVFGFLVSGTLHYPVVPRRSESGLRHEETPSYPPSAPSASTATNAAGQQRRTAHKQHRASGKEQVHG